MPPFRTTLTSRLPKFFAAAICTLQVVAAGHAQAQQTQHKPPTLVIISVDGMKPEYATHADEHGLKIPVLRSFLTQGTYAEGVTGVIPTVTYPSHTTIVTGVWPAEHGVTDNTIFDPLRQHPDTWYWDFKDIHVPTLYTAADAAGLKTAAVGWPVTVGAPIDYLIAEGTQSEHTDTPSGPPLHPADILTQLNLPRPSGNYSDTDKTAEAVAILQKFRPNLMLVHLTNLDHEEHEHSPFSAEANATIETIDAQIGQIRQALLAIDPNGRLAIVSDHGFLAVEHHTNLGVLLVQAGLIRLGPVEPGKKQPTVLDWQASGWPAGGDMAIVLHDPSDKAMLAKVKALLDQAAADPSYGIAQVLSQPEIKQRGGFPQASFLVDFKPEYSPGSNLTGPVVTDAPHTGTHGYLPTNPQMRSTFMVEGSGIAPGRDLHIIDMRQLAPTFAQMLGIPLPTAKQPPVSYKP